MKAIGPAHRKVKSRCTEEYLIQDEILFRRPPVKKPAEQLRRVVSEDEAFNVIVEAHTSLLHAGKNKTFSEVNDRYYGITREEVAFLLRMCRTCVSNK